MKKPRDVTGRGHDANLLFRLGIRLRNLPNPCGMCGSPWHPASGSLEKDGSLRCGACVRSLMQCLREVAGPARTVRGYKFYRYAYPPPPEKP